MSGAPRWAVLLSTVIGAAAGIVGSTWTSRVQRRSAGRAEWFRRLQWSWELTQRQDERSVAAGMTMMNYLADATDRKDAIIIEGIAPIAREVGPLASDYPESPARVELYDIDSPPGSSHTGGKQRHEDGERVDEQ